MAIGSIPVIFRRTPMSDTRVLVLVGSLRAGSFNRRLAEAVQAKAPAGVVIDIASGLADVPFYNEDLDGDDAPAAATSLRAQVAAADRVMVITPEYNGTMPAVLNNALDWTSRPFGAGSLKGKPLAVVGASVGAYGGKWAHDDTRRSATVAGASVVEDIVINHRYAWGEDPVSDAETVQAFVDAVAALVAIEVAAA
jgi:NAD(P)H-dependent FMN reductase